MKAVWQWIGRRTGMDSAMRACSERCMLGPSGWSRVWPAAIALTLFVQLVTGFFIWMHYSPGVQNAWESIHYLQDEVAGGWLLRAMHHYAAQVLLILVGLYLVQTIMTGAYRAPRELAFWTILLMGAVTLGLMLTGDLLRWDQNGYSATQVRVEFLNLLPGVGGSLFKAAVGGPEPSFGQLTLPRFLALHVGLLTASMLVLLLLHVVFLRRADALAEAESDERAGADAPPAAATCPGQCLRNALACGAVLLVVLVLSLLHAGGSPPGLELGSPADPAGSYPAARPEWAFLGLYEFAHLFSTYVSGQWGIVPIFIVPGLTMLLFLAMPWIAWTRRGHVFNVAVTLFLLAALTVMSFVTVARDRANPEFVAAVAAERQRAARTRELIQGYGGVPATGALALLAHDPKTRGPELAGQHCTSCHVYAAPDETAMTPDEISGPDLYGFASRQWLADFLDPAQIGAERFYGNTRFATGMMVRYVESRFARLPEEDREAIVAAVSAQAALAQQAEQDAKDAEVIRRGEQLLIKDGTCTRCHTLGDEGTPGIAPDLTGYGSRAWLVGVIADPTHPAFYGERNDRMPSYAASADKPAENLLSVRDVGLLADWMRGDWYRPGEAERFELQPQPSPERILDAWIARRPAPPEPETGPYAAARTLYHREHCSLCHAMTGAPGGDIAAIDSSAPDLGGFATREWIAGLLDPKQIQTSKYFGDSVFRAGEMVNYVRNVLPDLIETEEDQEELRLLVIALSAEAELPGQKDLDAADAERIKEGRDMMGDFGCTDCHTFRGRGGISGPDLTGYGSREWLAGILSDPEAPRFYGTRNDGMPSYRAMPDQPQRNLLSAEEIDELVAFLRNEPRSRPADKDD
jgi:quinol-cytochrome oxidoreductase complex cytochrome b subunit/mono/diheme cytochrome c family protein